MKNPLTMRIASDSERGLSKRIPFTVVALHVAACPAGKDRIWIYDTRQPGLALMLTAAGAKTFYLYRKVHGRPQRVRLGVFPEVTVEQARKFAKQKIGDIANGRDPMADRREARVKGMNLGDLFVWFLSDWAKPRKRSWRDDENRYEKHLKPWAARRLTDITRVDVAALHRRIADETSGATANRVLALLSTMFNKGRLIGWEKDNPCRGVEKFKETSRERFLNADELQRMFAAIETSDTVWQHFFKLLLFTGARRGNLMSAMWSEIDLNNAQWTIPGEKFKNGKSMTIALTGPAMEILKSRKDNGSQYVFPSDRRDGHITKPEHAWRDICKRAKLPGVRIHDLRRTAGSWMVAGGASLAVVGKALGHRTQQTTAVYARLELDPIRKSLESATAAMIAATKGGNQ